MGLDTERGNRMFNLFVIAFIIAFVIGFVVGGVTVYTVFKL